MTDEEMKTVEEINQMSQREMASLWRFAPAISKFWDSQRRRGD